VQFIELGAFGPSARVFGFVVDVDDEPVVTGAVSAVVKRGAVVVETVAATHIGDGEWHADLTALSTAQLGTLTVSFGLSRVQVEVTGPIPISRAQVKPAAGTLVPQRVLVEEIAATLAEAESLTGVGMLTRAGQLSARTAVARVLSAPNLVWSSILFGAVPVPPAELDFWVPGPTGDIALRPGVAPTVTPSLGDLITATFTYGLVSVDDADLVGALITHCRYRVTRSRSAQPARVQYGFQSDSGSFVRLAGSSPIKTGIDGVDEHYDRVRASWGFAG
jgi:hypothetical protein